MLLQKVRHSCYSDLFLLFWLFCMWCLYMCCTYMWMCMCTGVCAVGFQEASSQLQVSSSITLHLKFSDRVSHWTQSSNWIGRPASVLVGSPVSTFPALVVYTHNTADLNLHGCWRAGDPNVGPLLTQQTSDQLTRFASFSNSLLKPCSLAREAINPFNYSA